jgi:rRNA maturation endonuclease Nob1
VIACEECGHPLPGDARFCASCGAPAGEAGTDEAHETDDPLVASEEPGGGAS